MLLSLRNARRLEQAIEKYICELSTNGLKTSSVKISMYENFDEKLTGIQTLILDTFNIIDRMTLIRSDIRRSLQKTNENCGLNSLISEEARLKSLVSILTNDAIGEELLDSDRMIAKKRHESLNMTGPVIDNFGKHDDITVRAVLEKATLAKLGKQLKIHRKRLRDIVDETTVLNTTANISVFDDDVSFLQSHDILV